MDATGRQPFPQSMKQALARNMSMLAPWSRISSLQKGEQEMLVSKPLSQWWFAIAVWAKTKEMYYDRKAKYNVPANKSFKNK